jgi:peptidoglycan/LPS O-acetylase OafA/YrhL
MTTNQPEPGGRLYALDNLRALMMWLGIVLHVSVIYMAGEPVLPWRDEQRTRLADLLMAFIHSFRMPVFFILAGFFVALLLQSRGPAGLARHRALRLGLPFAAFWPPVFVATVAASMIFIHQMARGRWGFDPTLLPRDVPAGPSTMHMWFLWMLLWLSLGTAAAARWLPVRVFALPGRVLQKLGAAWWGPLVLTLPLMAAGGSYPHGLIRPSGAFLPPLAEWVHNGVFFLFGLALFHQQWQLFDLYRRRWWAYAIAGLVPFLTVGAMFERGAAAGWIAFTYNLTSWLWSFALIGLALKVLDRRNAVLAYLADSSYWVYLVHMPLTVFFGLLLYGAPLHAEAKMAIDIAATTVVCLASYHLLVRFTWVSVLLNGKRHARSPADGVLSHVRT